MINNMVVLVQQLGLVIILIFHLSHLCVMKKSELEGIKKGMIVSSRNEICNFGSGRDYNGKESISVNQAVPIVEACKKVKKFWCV